VHPTSLDTVPCAVLAVDWPGELAVGSVSRGALVGVGRDLCGSSSPTLLPKQGHLQQAAQDLVQAGLEYLQRRRLHNLPGQLAFKGHSAQMSFVG